MPYGDLPKIKTTDGSEIEGFPVHIHNPPKDAVLRLPSTDEMIAYLAVHVTRYRDIGRGNEIPEAVTNTRADLSLFTALRLDKGVDFDAAEIEHALSLLT